MDMRMKLTFTAFVIIVDFLLLVGPFRYFRNRKELDSLLR
jgi:hypothetical protein